MKVWVKGKVYDYEKESKRKVHKKMLFKIWRYLFNVFITIEKPINSN